MYYVPKPNPKTLFSSQKEIASAQYKKHSFLGKNGFLIVSRRKTIQKVWYPFVKVHQVNWFLISKNREYLMYSFERMSSKLAFRHYYHKLAAFFFQDLATLPTFLCIKLLVSNFLRKCATISASQNGCGCMGLQKTFKNNFSVTSSSSMIMDRTQTVLSKAILADRFKKSWLWKTVPTSVVRLCFISNTAMYLCSRYSQKHYFAPIIFITFMIFGDK